MGIWSWKVPDAVVDREWIRAAYVDQHGSHHNFQLLWNYFLVLGQEVPWHYSQIFRA